LIFEPGEVIGHRGAGRGQGADGTTQENTPESLRSAVAQGADWVEIDVHRSAEDTLFLHHDATLPDGRVLVELPDDECHKAGLYTLEEGIEALPSDFPINVEIKTVMNDAVDAPARRTTALVVAHLAREARRRRLFASSFDPAAVLALGRELPSLPVAWMPWVRGPADLGVAGATGLGCAAVGIDARSFGAGDAEPRPHHWDLAGAVEMAHRAGLQLYSWSPAPQDAARFLAAGADAVCVDDIPGTVTALAADAEVRGES
jgi:glycerophosphoryl diester phosphodiesterase